MPLYKGDSTGLVPDGIASIRLGDGTFIWEPINQITVTATLNSSSGTLVALEDTDEDGAFENEATYTLQDGTTTYDASMFDLSAENYMEFHVQTDKAGATTAGIDINEIKLTY